MKYLVRAFVTDAICIGDIQVTAVDQKAARAIAAAKFPKAMKFYVTEIEEDPIDGTPT